ncbi:TAXI family TRAP transporter solute-binding subunit [Treponema primitia]|uniref:TAXI family TRAP transporter solute-binding subunit n=1 Tax=Treponema primitia TaxID=88058 RepID=UPI0039804CD1
MKKGKTCFCIVMIFSITLLFVGCKKKDDAEKKDTVVPGSVTRISIGTANTSGISYIFGGALANLINQKLSGIEATAEVTAGGVENINLLQARELEFGIAPTESLYFSWEGTAPFQSANKELRLVGKLWPSTMHIVALQSANIKSVSDLKGKRVSVGAPGAAQRIYIKIILESYGLDFKDLVSLDIGYSEGIDGMKDDLVDAVFFQTGGPNASIMDLALSKKINLVPIDPDKANFIVQKYSYANQSVIPASMYKTDSDARVIHTNNCIVCRSDIDDNTVYQITKLIFENIDALKNAHTILGEIRPNVAAEAIIPLHPGAERYYREIGIIK